MDACWIAVMGGAFWYRDNRDQEEARGVADGRSWRCRWTSSWRGCWSTCRRPGCRRARVRLVCQQANSRSGRWSGRSWGRRPKPAERPKLKWWELCERLGWRCSAVCRCAAAPLVLARLVPRGRFSRLDHPSPPALAAAGRSAGAVAPTPPGRRPDSCRWRCSGVALRGSGYRSARAVAETPSSWYPVAVFGSGGSRASSAFCPFRWAT